MTYTVKVSFVGNEKPEIKYDLCELEVIDLIHNKFKFKYIIKKIEIINKK